LCEITYLIAVLPDAWHQTQALLFSSGFKVALQNALCAGHFDLYFYLAYLQAAARQSEGGE
jgi:hypothetical protein